MKEKDTEKTNSIETNLSLLTKQIKFLPIKCQQFNKKLLNLKKSSWWKMFNKMEDPFKSSIVKN